MVFGLSGQILAGNAFDSQTQPLITSTPSLQVQRVSVAPTIMTSATSMSAALKDQQLPLAKEPISSLALAAISQGLVLREEQSNINYKKSPIKVDVSVKVVPKPKTKKSCNHHKNEK